MGIISANNMPNTRLVITSVVIPVTANSLPPLNPMANNKYREMKLFVAAGISKSLLTYFAKTPRIKNSKVGFVRLKVNSSKLIIRGGLQAKLIFAK
jgi:hypothetical protein